jgi:hypothetical protein
MQQRVHKRGCNALCGNAESVSKDNESESKSDSEGNDEASQRQLRNLRGLGALFVRTHATITFVCGIYTLQLLLCIQADARAVTTGDNFNPSRNLCRPGTNNAL